MPSLIDMASGIFSRESRALETAAQNIANLSTPGYKRAVHFSTFLGPGSVNSARQPATPVGANATDFSPGKLVPSSSATHLAISGSGFFQLQTDAGPAYTRSGSFQIDERGRLISPQGWPVQAAGGGDVVIQDPNWKLAPDGTVLESGRPTARILLVDFQDKHGLQRTLGGLFQSDARPVEIDMPVIRQGYLESSNVSSATDMVQLMETIRRAETAQKLVHAYDDMLGRALRQPGEA
ncbi:MAG: hypothetical protein ABS43_17640 [Bordetella sp. SCN 67-23]|nr:flagellar hook basal-body protein [Burkholderiales bacterium]ODS72338.1 MAG: hypothetical protein ABS43_17640 [Bordetella sp. SCN 67-23]ODU68705.1 MAG: hypothetical protein ABT00_19405 [Bordetella sp. SCN 68-11]OJW86882.1 MAG: hypothetical protein BGO71_26470 [Burkholderiales bacterium 67-32]